MLIPMGALVEEVMVACVQTYIVGHTPLCSQGQQGRGVLWNASAVDEFIGGRDDRGLFQVRLVLHAHTGLELILGCEVESAGLIVDAEHWSNAPACLVGHKVDTVGVGGECSGTGCELITHCLQVLPSSNQLLHLR